MFSEIRFIAVGVLDHKLKLLVSYEKFKFDIKSNNEKFKEKTCLGYFRCD